MPLKHAITKCSLGESTPVFRLKIESPTIERKNSLILVESNYRQNS